MSRYTILFSYSYLFWVLIYYLDLNAEYYAISLKIMPVSQMKITIYS